MQGLLASPSRTETAATGDRQDAHHILCSRYSRVQFRTVPCILTALSTGNVCAMRYHAMLMI